MVVGFDAGTGLLASDDPRDLLYCWPAQALSKWTARRWSDASVASPELILGDVRATIAQWEPRPDAPIGTVFFDSRYVFVHSQCFRPSLKRQIRSHAFGAISMTSGGAMASRRLPAESVSEAIRQFNLDSRRALQNDHLSPAYSFKGTPPEAWHQQIYAYHRMNHPDYNRRLTESEEHQPATDRSSDS